LIDARTINQAAKKVMSTATVAELMLTVRLFSTERMMLLSANAVA
jgi:hypothetical protein